MVRGVKECSCPIRHNHYVSQNCSLSLFRSIALSLSDNWEASGPSAGDIVELLPHGIAESWFGKECEIVSIDDDGLATVKIVNSTLQLNGKTTFWPTDSMKRRTAFANLPPEIMVNIILLAPPMIIDIPKTCSEFATVVIRAWKLTNADIAWLNFLADRKIHDCKRARAAQQLCVDHGAIPARLVRMGLVEKSPRNKNWFSLVPLGRLMTGN